jgi:hypothetical protein
MFVLSKGSCALLPDQYTRSENSRSETAMAYHEAKLRVPETTCLKTGFVKEMLLHGARVKEPGHTGGTDVNIP